MTDTYQQDRDMDLHVQIEIAACVNSNTLK